MTRMPLESLLVDPRPGDIGPAGPSAAETWRLVDPRIARVLDISSILVLLVMAPLGIAGLATLWSQVLAGVLCVGYGALELAGPRTAVGRRHPAVFLGLQTASVAALLTLRSESYVAFAFLFVLLSMRVVLAFGVRRGAVWIGVFWVISSIAAIWTDGRYGVFDSVFNLGVYPLCGMVGALVAALTRSTAERTAALADLRQAQEQLSRLAVDAERRRLGRDLHDSVKQQVFAAVMQMGAARALLPQQPERALSAVEGAESAARRAGTELNLVIHELRSDDLDHGLPSALRQLADSWAKQNTAEVDCRLPDRVRTSFAESSALLRVAQEALTNATRHARADKVTLRLAESAAELELIIVDDGVGFDPDQPRTGVGLTSMAERMAGLGGRLSVQSAAGHGSTVRAVLPLAGDHHG